MNVQVSPVTSRAPRLFPLLGVAERVLESPLGSKVSGFHIHSVDDTLTEMYTESVVGTFHGLPVRSIRSLPQRPIALGPKTPVGSIDHVAVDFLVEPVPTIDEFDGIQSLFPDGKILTQINPNCCGILVSRKLWIFVEGFPPLEVALGPKGKGVEGCDPRPAWPD
jgi:hypothetical protein